MWTFLYLLIAFVSFIAIDSAVADGMETPAKKSGFYVTADAGGATLQKQHYNATNMGLAPFGPFGSNQVGEIDSLNAFNFTWSAGLGWQFSQLFRLDITYSNFRLPFIGHTFDTDSIGSVSPASGTVTGHSHTYLINGYFDLLSLFGNNTTIIRPYIGAGIGVSENNTKNIDFTINFFPAIPAKLNGHRRADFAYCFIAGFRYPIVKELKLFAQYSYFALGKYASGSEFSVPFGSGFFRVPVKIHIHSNVFSGGLMYLF